ncbi:Protein of unknown function [Halopseudomonas litoralis]|uniref:DUF2489 domain-containing protein n=1 Tax=Halopseudomonas litoralis TaxID=797277 RepID=A0A1H1TVH0_9GAMM|nr:DUF2489 domain-containing protein [Halopseudomonas litoralis]SDS64315.1 Protein of unknown function [Halopseudomonas litoralis]
MTNNDWLIILGLVIIFALAMYAVILWRRVWRNQQLLTRKEEERNVRLEGDIRILAQSLVTGQLPVIEGAIRIKVLLDNYSGARRADLDVRVFETIYDATAHIPTHQAWKDLPKAQRKLHERQMETLEAQHRSEVEQVARVLSNGVRPDDQGAAGRRQTAE